MSLELSLFAGSLHLLTANINAHIAKVDLGFREERHQEAHDALTRRVELLIGEVKDAILKVKLILGQSEHKGLNEALEDLQGLDRLLQKPWTSKC